MFCVHLSSDMSSRHIYMNSNKNRNDFCRIALFFPHLNMNKLNTEYSNRTDVTAAMNSIMMKKSALKRDFNANELSIVFFRIGECFFTIFMKQLSELKQPTYLRKLDEANSKE